MTSAISEHAPEADCQLPTPLLPFDLTRANGSNGPKVDMALDRHTRTNVNTSIAIEASTR